MRLLASSAGVGSRPLLLAGGPADRIVLFRSLPHRGAENRRLFWPRRWMSCWRRPLNFSRTSSIDRPHLRPRSQNLDLLVLPGVVAMLTLPMCAFPDITPRIFVSATYSGRSAAGVGDVAAPSSSRSTAPTA